MRRRSGRPGARRIPPPWARRRPRNRIHLAYRHRTRRTAQPRDVRGRFTGRPQAPAGCMMLFVVVFTIGFMILIHR